MGIGGRGSGDTLTPAMRLATALAALVILAIPLSAADWISLRSEHFQVHGNVTERELRDVALRLEQFREAISKLHPDSVPANAAPVIALIFRDDRSLRPFMPRANGRVVPVMGLFTPSPDAAYLALSLDSGEEAYAGIYHEYTHYLLGSAFAAVPVWLNEGLAEYYSMFEVTNGGRSAQVGRPHERHIAMLRQRRMALPQLFGITRGSAEYTRDIPDRSVLYAQSWLVVHHALHGAPRRRDQLIAFARRMASGGDLATSLKETYGLSVTELDRELQTYVRRPVFQYTNVDFTTNLQTRIEARATPAEESELDARLGGLAAVTGNIDEASRRLERALKAKPDAGYVHMSLSLVRTRQGRSAEASTHLQRARALGGLPSSPVVFERRLTAAELREQFPELAATLEASRPPAAAPREPIEVARAPEPRARLLLSPLKAGEQATLGTLEAVECGAAGITVVMRTTDNVVRAIADGFTAVAFTTFRTDTEASIACGKQPPAPARLVSRREGASLVAVSLELLPDDYVP